MIGTGRKAGLRTGLVLLLSLSACSPRAPSVVEREKLAAVPGQNCPERAKADEQAELERGERDQAFFALAASGNGDPVAEARRAIAAGDARFLGFSMRVPGIEPAAYGVECRPDLRLLRKPPVRAVFAGSDVIGSPEAMAEERRSEENFARFAVAYNAALIADPRYPYGDICRAGVSGYRPEMAVQPAPVSTWGFRDLVPTDRPVDLGEAARRGSLDSLKKLIKAHPEAVNRADMFAMTPLGWAIAYRRQDHVFALLAAGANPVGTDCGHVSEPTAPIQIARSMRWRAMVAALLPRIDAAERVRLAEPAAPDPKVSIDLNDLRRPLGQQTVVAMLDIDAEGRTRGCAITTSSSDARVDRQVCAALVKRRRWLPARDEFGDPVASQREDRIHFR